MNLADVIVGLRRGEGPGGTRLEFVQVSEFVQHPRDERVRAVPHRLERPVEGGSDLLRALARDEMPQN
jgi:hypothetical protein